MVPYLCPQRCRTLGGKGGTPSRPKVPYPWAADRAPWATGCAVRCGWIGQGCLWLRAGETQRQLNNIASAMKALKYVVPVLLWGAVTAALVVSNDNVRTSAHARIHEQCASIYLATGVASGAFAVALASLRKPEALSFGIYAILHGVALPFLMWPSTVQVYGIGLLVPAISIIVGLRGVMMHVRQRKRTP